MDVRKVKKEFKKLGYNISGDIRKMSRAEVDKLKRQASQPGIFINGSFHIFCWSVNPLKIKLPKPHKYQWIEWILSLFTNRNKIRLYFPYIPRFYHFLDNWLIEGKLRIVNYQNNIYLECQPLYVYLNPDMNRIEVTITYTREIVVPGDNHNTNFNIV